MNIGILCRNKHQFHNTIETMIERGQLSKENVVETYKECVYMKGGNKIQMLTVEQSTENFDLIIPEVNMPNIVNLAGFGKVN